MPVAIVVVVTVVLGGATVARGHEKGFPTRTLKAAFPKAESFVEKSKTLSPDEVSIVERASGDRVAAADRNLKYYIAVVAQEGRRRSLGTVVLVDTRGPKGAIDLAVAVGLDGTLHRVLVTDNADDPAVGAEPFLRQFAGRPATSGLRVGEDIKAAGNPQAAEAVARAVRRGRALVQTAVQSANSASRQ
jgi:hypothetical protein